MTSNEEISKIEIVIKKIFGENHPNAKTVSKYLYNPEDRKKIIPVLKEIQDISRELKRISSEKVILSNNSELYGNNDFLNNFNIDIETKKFQNLIDFLDNTSKFINEHMIKHKLDESYLYSENNFSINLSFEIDIEEKDLLDTLTKEIKSISLLIFERLSNKEDPIGIIAGNETSPIYQVYFKIKSLSELSDLSDINYIKQKLSYAIKDIIFQKEIYRGKKGQNKDIFDFCDSVHKFLLKTEESINNFSKQIDYSDFITTLIKSFENKNDSAYSLDLYKIKDEEVASFIKRIKISTEQKYLLQQFLKSTFLGKNDFCNINVENIKDFIMKNDIKVIDHNKLKALAEYIKPFLGSFSKNIKDINDLVSKTLVVLFSKDEILKKNLLSVLDNIWAEIFDILWIEEQLKLNNNLLLILKNMLISLEQPISSFQRDRREVLFYSFIKYIFSLLAKKFENSEEIIYLKAHKDKKSNFIENIDKKDLEKKNSISNLSLKLRMKKKDLEMVLNQIEAKIIENAKGKKDIPYNIIKPIPVIENKKSFDASQEKIDKKDNVEGNYENKLTTTFYGKKDFQEEIQKALKEAERIKKENENK